MAWAGAEKRAQPSMPRMHAISEEKPWGLRPPIEGEPWFELQKSRLGLSSSSGLWFNRAFWDGLQPWSFATLPIRSSGVRQPQRYHRGASQFCLDLAVQIIEPTHSGRALVKCAREAEGSLKR